MSTTPHDPRESADQGQEPGDRLDEGAALEQRQPGAPSPRSDELSPEELLPKHCGYYRAGHEIHWIQAKKAMNDPKRVPGELVSVDPDGTLVVRSGGEMIRLWNHEPDRLRTVVARDGRAVSLQLRWRLLRAGTAGRETWFCVGDESPPSTPCIDRRTNS